MRPRTLSCGVGCDRESRTHRVGNRVGWTRLFPQTSAAILLSHIVHASLVGLALLCAVGCTPTVKVEAPRDPITINLNIKLDADVRLRVEEEAKKDVSTKPIF